MTPDISEFSYGFALTNEIVGWVPITAAPLFPSLIEEGKVGGGYDVKLDLPGIALYLQFKRADCMTRSTAREISKYYLPLSLPFYRFKIAEAANSDQHELLLALDDGTCSVFYAAPRFHKIPEINAAWTSNTVASRSIFVAPSQIGTLDDAPHHVAFDGKKAWACSDPEEIAYLDSTHLVERLNERLHAETRPLRETIPALVQHIRSARQRAATRIAENRAASARRIIDQATETLNPPETPVTPIRGRAPRALSEPQRQLREVSDDAARIFNAQLVIVQPSGI
jgi:hypothetical protein